MSDLSKLNEVNIDILKELSNISSGHALKSFIELTDLSLDIRVPEIKLIDFRDLPKIFGDEDNIIAAVSQEVAGEINASILIGMDGPSISVLLKNMYKKFSLECKDDDISIENLSEDHLSVLTEVGSILSGTYISTLSDFVKASATLSCACIAVDMAGAIMSQILCTLDSNPDKVLILGTEIFVNDETINTKIILLPDDDTLDYLISSVNKYYVNV